MDNNLLEKYKAEMLKMYSTVNQRDAVSTVAETIPKEPEISKTETVTQSTTQGSLIGIVTAIRGLYPIKNAKVSIFTGDYPDNMNIIDSDLTNNSGRTKTFLLPTPERSLSLDQNNTIIPYSLYNMAIESDGYIKNIHLNIPVFSTVTSLQQSNLTLEETAGEDKSPQIFDESQNYNL